MQHFEVAQCNTRNTAINIWNYSSHEVKCTKFDRLWPKQNSSRIAGDILKCVWLRLSYGQLVHMFRGYRGSRMCPPIISEEYLSNKPETNHVAVWDVLLIHLRKCHVSIGMECRPNDFWYPVTTQFRYCANLYSSHDHQKVSLATSVQLYVQAINKKNIKITGLVKQKDFTCHEDIMVTFWKGSFLIHTDCGEEPYNRVLCDILEVRESCSLQCNIHPDIDQHGILPRLTINAAGSEWHI